LEGLAGAGLGATVGGGKPAAATEVPPAAPPVAPPPAAPKAEPPEPEKPMITRVMDMAAQQNGYGLLEQQKQRLLAEPQTEDIKKELTFIQEIQDRMNIETAQRLTPSGKSPFTITPDALTELGIKPTAPIIKRINGKAYDDPYVIEQLEKFAANKNVAPEVQQSVLAFVEQLRQPVEPPAAPPVSEAPPAPPVEPAAEAPPVEPAPEAPPVAAVEPSVAEDSELVTPAPQSIVLKDGSNTKIESVLNPTAFTETSKPIARDILLWAFKMHIINVIPQELGLSGYSRSGKKPGQKTDPKADKKTTVKTMFLIDSAFVCSSKILVSLIRA
jgi:hypothetical protein